MKKDDLDPFSERFQDHYNKDGKPIMFRNRMHKLMKGDGEAEYDNEEDYASQAQGPGEEDDDGMEYMSQQPEEVYDIVMNPFKVELDSYL